MKRSEACIRFKKALLPIYKESGIVVAFFTYLGFLRQFTKNKQLVEFTDWQVDDMLMCLENEKIDNSKEALEIAINYTRRGGKSRKLSMYH